MVVAYIQGCCSSCISEKFAKWFVISNIWENDLFCLGKGELTLLFISKHVPIASIKKFASDLCKFFLGDEVMNGSVYYCMTFKSTSLLCKKKTLNGDF